MLRYDLSYYFQKYQRPLKWGGLGLVVLIIGASCLYFILSAASHKGKIAVPVQVVPADATIMLDHTTELDTGTAYITPGMHHITVTSPGFSSVEKDYRIERYNAPAIYIALNGQSDDAKQWQQRHHNDYRKLELLTTKQAHTYAKKFQARNPIVKDLPIKDPYFTISYRNIDDKTIKLTIWGTSARYREFAINYLRSKGYEPTDYHIDFTNFHNPLDKESNRE